MIRSEAHESGITQEQLELQQETIFNQDLGLNIVNLLQFCIQDVQPIDYLLPVAVEKIKGREKTISFHTQTGQCYIDHQKGVGNLLFVDLAFFLKLYSSLEGMETEQAFDWYNELFLNQREINSPNIYRMAISNLRKILADNVKVVEAHNVIKPLYGEKTLGAVSPLGDVYTQEDLIPFAKAAIETLEFFVYSRNSEKDQILSRREYFRKENNQRALLLESLKGFVPPKGIDGSKINLFCFKNEYVQLDVERRTILGKKEVHLTVRELELLITLIAALGKRLQKGEIARRMENVRGEFQESVSNRGAVDVYLESLRRKLDEAFPGLSIITQTCRPGVRFNIEESGLLGDSWVTKN